MALNDAGVDYMLIGGAAAELHGATRHTQDVDVLARRTAANRARIAQALNELGARLRAEGRRRRRSPSTDTVLGR